MNLHSFLASLRNILHPGRSRALSTPGEPGPDISGLRKELEESSKARARLASENSAIMELSSDGILIISSPAHLEAANSSALRMFGISPDQVLPEGTEHQSYSRTADMFFVRSPALLELFGNTLEQGKAEIPSLKLFPGQEERVFTVRARKIMDEDHVRVLMVLHDISAEYQTDAVKRSFVANVSHELRTPIQIIHGYAEMLDSIELEDEKKSWIQVILRQTERMETLISDLLMLARLEQNPEAWIKKSRFRVLPVLENAVHTISLQTGGAFECTIDCPASLEIDANASLIEQAVFNLLSNAVQHSGSKNPIEIHARDERGECIIQVRDHGVGIPPGDLPHVFERFYRVDRGRSRSSAGAGSGLGLAIVKHIAKAHGGSVHAESWAGEGSLFEFRIPAGSDHA